MDLRVVLQTGRVLIHSVVKGTKTLYKQAVSRQIPTSEKLKNSLYHELVLSKHISSIGGRKLSGEFALFHDSCTSWIIETRGEGQERLRTKGISVTKLP